MALSDEGVTAWGTVAVAVVALGTASWGFWQSARQTKRERIRADKQLRDERVRADEQLREERERSDRERRIERNVALLLEVYDLHADYKNEQTPIRDAALFKLHARLAVLPWTVATLIRLDIGDELLPEPEEKKNWVVIQRAGRKRTEVNPNEVGFALLKHEIAADLWFLRNDQPFDDPRWWRTYDKQYPTIGGYVIPGTAAPNGSAV